MSIYTKTIIYYNIILLYKKNYCAIIYSNAQYYSFIISFSVTLTLLIKRRKYFYKISFQIDSLKMRFNFIFSCYNTKLELFERTFFIFQ